MEESVKYKKIYENFNQVRLWSDWNSRRVGKK